MKLRLLPFTATASHWTQVLGWLLPAAPARTRDGEVPLRVHVVRLGAAGTAYPAALREEPRRHPGARRR